jgi:hypothetical protein
MEGISMMTTKEAQQEAERAVLKAAVAWWESRRPMGWALDQHLKNPAVNTHDQAERLLAITVAKAVAVSHP